MQLKVVSTLLGHVAPGETLAVYGSSEPHQHLNDQRKGVWNVKAFAATEEIILCSSLLDALTFWTHNHRNVTCMFGDDTLTLDHLEALRRFKIKRVLTPCRKTAGKLVDAGFESGFLTIPKGKDINSYALDWSDVGDALDRIVQKARWMKPTVSAAVPDSPPASTTPEPVQTPAMVMPTPDEAYQPPALPILPLPEPQEHDVPVSDAPPPTLTDPNADEINIVSGTRRYRVRGFARNVASDTCKVNVLVSNDDALFIDTLDLYAAKHRRLFISQAAVELDVVEQTIKKDLDRVLTHLEQLQAERSPR